MNSELFNKIDAAASAPGFEFKWWKTWDAACNAACRKCVKANELVWGNGTNYSDEFMAYTLEALKGKIKRKANGHEFFASMM
jgi:hypothetical protein